MNSLTLNLHLAMISFYTPTKARHKILIEAGAFPSDLYAALTQAKFHGFNAENSVIEMKPREGEHTLRTDDILTLLKEQGQEIALVMFPGVQFETGQCFEMEKITTAAHEQGCTVGFDLAHAVGNVELRLHDWGVDFAAWCSYKYLNSGPGAIGGFFIHENHFKKDLRVLGGWWGVPVEKRFSFEAPWDPEEGANRYRLSNPSVFSIMPLIASLKIFEEVGMEALRKKARKLTAYFEYLVDEELKEGIGIITPRNVEERGCQLSLVLKDESLDIKKLGESLKKKGIICDLRKTVVRVAPVPLYNSFSDVRRFITILKECMAEVK